MSKGSTTNYALTADALDAVARAGELLIRAAATLGTLTPAELQALSAATEGKLPDCLTWALAAAAALSPDVQESLRTHPPKGAKIHLGPQVDVQLLGTA